MKDIFQLKQIVDGSGNIVSEEGSDLITEDMTKNFYRLMVRARTFDRKAINMQRQGRLGTYAPFEGQEAAQIGSASALSKEDWVFPTYRDHAATMTFGHPLKNILMYWNGRVEGCVPSEKLRVFPPAVPIATQLPHAAGAAWAEKMKGSDNAVIAYFGDGATSEGDFHEGLNFASVFDAPVVFFNQNNGFAISVPMERQMKSKTIAQKALSYDIPGIRVDGNDVFAVHHVTQEALTRARSGNGPTLIEAVTWRYGAHTTADDPTKYRNQEESERNREQNDPILRMERLMKRMNWWDEDWADMVQQKASAEIENAIIEMEEMPSVDPMVMFDHVFSAPTWTIQKQREAFLQNMRGEV